MVEHIDALTQVPELYGLQEVKAVQAVVAQELLEDTLPAPEIQALLTHVNNDIYRRVAEKAVALIEEERGGEPPVRFAVIVMGSSGRGENFINPDSGQRHHPRRLSRGAAQPSQRLLHPVLGTADPESRRHRLSPV